MRLGRVSAVAMGRPPDFALEVQSAKRAGSRRRRSARGAVAADDGRDAGGPCSRGAGSCRGAGPTGWGSGMRRAGKGAVRCRGADGIRLESDQATSQGRREYRDPARSRASSRAGTVSPCDPAEHGFRRAVRIPDFFGSPPVFDWNACGPLRAWTRRFCACDAIHDARSRESRRAACPSPVRLPCRGRAAAGARYRPLGACLAGRLSRCVIRRVGRGKSRGVVPE